MLRNIQRVVFFVALVAAVSAAPIAWAGHGHGGHGHGGHFGGHSHFGGHGHFGYGHSYGHYHARPYYYYPFNYYRPYGVYPYGYYGDGDYYSDLQPRRQYTVSRPATDVARVEVRMPDSNGTVWIQGKQMSSKGAVRRFTSPTLDSATEYVYTVRAEWNDNGRPVTDQRKVAVRADSSAVVDFGRSDETVRVGSSDDPTLPAPQRPITQ